MKIAILSLHFIPKWLGGAEIALYNIATILSQRSHDVHIITLLDKGLLKDNYQDGFYIHRISDKNIKFFSLVICWIKIFFYIKSINPDVIHLQQISKLGIPALFSKKIQKKPYVVYLRGSDIYFANFFWKKLFKFILANADRVIVLTEDMKRKVKNIYFGEILVIPNGIDERMCTNSQKLNLKTNMKKTIIFVGTLRKVKGLKYLIKSMEIVYKNYKNLVLMIIGDGDERKFLEVMVKKLKLEEVVLFIGKLPNKDVFDYMLRSDIFVLPSLSEGFPNVILEAMAAGLPIVSTRVCGLAEIIKDGENGYLVEPKNPQELAEKILKLLNNSEKSKIISYNNMKKVKQYSWKNIVECLEDAYHKVLIN